MLIRKPIMTILIVASIISQTADPALADEELLSRIISTCSNEVLWYAKEHDIQVGKQKLYMVPQWQIYKYKNSVVILLTVRHNFYWLGPYSGLIDEPKTSQAIFYGAYNNMDGWVWYALRLSYLPQNKEEIMKELTVMEKRWPIGIVDSVIKEPHHSIIIRYLCKKFINEVFPVTNGH